MEKLFQKSEHVENPDKSYKEHSAQLAEAESS